MKSFLLAFILLLCGHAYADQMRCTLKLRPGTKEWSTHVGPSTVYLFGHDDCQTYIPDYERAQNPYLRISLRNSVLRVSWRYVLEAASWERNNFKPVLDYGEEEFHLDPKVPFNISVSYPHSQTLLINCYP